MAKLIGKIETFDEKSSNWETYHERLELIFTVNSIKEDAQKVPLMLSYLGPAAYTTLRNLLAPDKLAEQTYKKLVDTLNEHYAPKPLVIAERFRFYKRDMGEQESITAYMAELRRLASTCDFGAFLEEALRDRLVCGLANESIQKRLLTEANLTLKKALELSLGMELAAKDATELQNKGATGLNRVAKHKSQQGRQQKCYRCGKRNHASDSCYFKQAKCHKCGTIGHIKSVCHKAPVSKQESQEPKKASRKEAKKKKQVKTLNCETDDSEEESSFEDDLVYGTHLLGINRGAASDIVYVSPLVEGKTLRMELDTGSAVSVISRDEYQRNFSEIPLEQTLIKLTTYTGETVVPVGVMKVHVAYNDQSTTSNLYVLESGPALLGREWLQSIKLDWQNLFQCSTVHNVSVNADHACRAELSTLLEKPKNVFQDGIGKLQGIKTKLHKKDDARPKFVKARQLPYAMRPKVEQELTRLVDAGILSPVETSEWATPIVPVLKDNGSVRICGDFKTTVNPVLNVDQYPLPTVDDIFSNLAGGQLFTKLDLTQAYLHLEVDEESRDLLTISTHRGLFRYNRLPYGIASAPAIWQRTMEMVLQDIPGTQVILDDMIITGKTMEEHLSNLAKVLERLDSKGLRVNKRKCAFMCPEIVFCGYKIDKDGLHKTEEKIDAVLEAPQPTNITQLRAFLGLINYYHRFLPNLSTVVHPLNQLLSSKKRWKWTRHCQKAFDSAKRLITSELVLTHYDPSLPLRVACDASPYGIGSVLSHIMPDGEERPIAYASRSLNPAERNYAQIDKEALALVWGVKKFYMYLWGRHFTLVTDHKPLTSIFSPDKTISPAAAARLQRYAAFLSGQSYSIEYRNTKDHSNADGLSRLPLRSGDKEPGNYTLDLMYVDMERSQLDPLPVTAQQVKLHTQRDLVISKAYEATRLGWSAHGQADDELKPFRSRRNELSITDGCLMWGSKVVIPTKLRPRVLSELHDGHMGVVKMKSVARSYVWWPGIDQDIETMAKSCTGCQQVQHMPAAAPLHVWEWPSAKWDRIHVDYAGPVDGQMFLVIVDAYSKWPFVIPTQSTTSTATINILQSIFASEGIPLQLVSDNGPQFVSEEFETFLKRNGVKHIKSAPYHPSSNGLAERFVQTFKQGLKAARKGSTQTKLANFLLAYRNAPHSTTGVSPATLFRGHNLRSRLDLIKPQIRATVNNKQADQAATRKTGEPRKFTVGQAVSVRDYRGKQKWIPGIVKAQTGPVSYQVQVGSQMVWRRHVDQLLDADTGQTVELNAPAETSADWYPTSQTDAPEPNNQQVAQQPVVRPEAPRGAAPKITRSGRTVKPNPKYSNQEFDCSTLYLYPCISF